MSDHRTGTFFSGVLVGAAIGAVTGLLMAPKTGRETRRILKKSMDALPELVEDLSTSLHLHADRLSESALDSWDDTLTRLRATIAAGQAAAEAEADAISQAESVESPHAATHEPS